MKLNKLFLFLFIPLFIFGFNNIVKADDDGVVAYLECRYKLSDLSLVDEYYLNDDNTLSFYYSEAVVNGDILKNKLFIKVNPTFAIGNGYIYYEEATDSTPFYGEFVGEDEYNSNNFDGFYEGIFNISKFKINSSEDAYRTFIYAYENNTRTCPNYFVLYKKQEAGGFLNLRKAIGIPRFTNDINDACDESRSNCFLTAELVSQPERFVIYPNEISWKFPSISSGGKACDKLEATFFMDTDNSFKGKIFYPEESDFYKDSAKKEVTTELDVGGRPLDFLYYLLNYNKVYTADINGKAGKESFRIIGGTMMGENYCNFNYVVNVTENFNCKKYDENEIKPYITNFNDQYKDLEDFANSHLNSLGDKWAPKDYSGYEDADELVSLAKEFEERSENIDLGDSLTNYLNAFDCSIDKSNLDLIYKEKNDKQDMIGKILSAMKETLENIINRLQELGFTEEAEQYSETLDRYDNLIEEINRIVAVNNMRNYLGDGVHFIDITGCGIFTDKLKAWLIQLLNVIKIAALVLTLVLGMVDFLKASASGEADAMKKTWKNFYRRLLIVVLLFLLPVIIEFILGLININGIETDNPLCGIK